MKLSSNASRNMPVKTRFKTFCSSYNNNKKIPFNITKAANRLNNLNRDKYKTLFSLLFISILTFFTYFQLSTHEFLIIDDQVYVTHNIHVKSGLTLQNILWAFTSLDAEFWHPLTWISYMVDTEIYGGAAGGYLLTNLLIHICNSILLFYLIKFMTGRIWESFFISALFALHPLHVEAVAWIAERKELLCAFFWLSASIAYYFYTKKICWKRYLLIVILFLMGIMSKSMIITFPFTLLLFDFWPLKRVICNSINKKDIKISSDIKEFNIKNRNNKTINADEITNQIINIGNISIERDLLKKVIIEKIPLFMITIIAGIITITAQHKGGGIVSIEEHSLLSRFVNAVTSYFIYIKKTVSSNDLSVFYPVKDISIPFFLFSIFFIITVSTLVIYFSFKKDQYGYDENNGFLLTGWFWFLGTLVPVIGIVKIGDFAMADRYTYMTINGLFIIFAFGISKFISKLKFQTLWRILVPLIVLISYVPNTFSQIQVWKNSRTLIQHSLNVTQNNFVAHHAMGELLAGEGNMETALEHFNKAAEIRPDKAPLWIKAGRAKAAADKEVKDGSWSENIDIFFIKAHNLVITSPVPHFYLTCVYLAQNDVIKALEQFFLLADKNELLKKDIEIKQLKNDFELYYNKNDENKNNENKNHKENNKIITSKSNNSLETLDKKNIKDKQHIERSMNRVLKEYGFVKSDEILRTLVVRGYESWFSRISSNNVRVSEKIGTASEK